MKLRLYSVSWRSGPGLRPSIRDFAVSGSFAGCGECAGTARCCSRRLFEAAIRNLRFGLAEPVLSIVRKSGCWFCALNFRTVAPKDGPTCRSRYPVPFRTCWEQGLLRRCSTLWNRSAFVRAGNSTCTHVDLVKIPSLRHGACNRFLRRDWLCCVVVLWQQAACIDFALVVFVLRTLDCVGPRQRFGLNAVVR